MKRRYTRAAAFELSSIYAYLIEENPSAANGVLEAVEKTIERLEVFPFSAVITDIRDVRVAIVRPYPYLLFYTVYEDTLVIRNVRHAARRRPRE